MNLKLLSTENFRKKAPFALAGDEGLLKEFVAEVKDLGNRQIKFTISTENPDRHQDTVAAKGWQTENYMKNPVVLFGHDYSALPIGKAVSVNRSKGSLEAVAEFATADLNPMADQVYRMLKAGFLKATSVGFIPLEWEATKDESRPYGYDFTKQELLEFSVVPVPANADCLMQGKSLGIDVGLLKSWAEKALATCKDAADRQALKDLSDAAAKAAASESPVQAASADPAVKPAGSVAPVQVEASAPKEDDVTKELLEAIQALSAKIDALKPAPEAKADPAPAVEPKPEAKNEDEYTEEELKMLVTAAMDEFEYRCLGRVAA